jgi:hypothetical protein
MRATLTRLLAPLCVALAGLTLTATAQPPDAVAPPPPPPSRQPIIGDFAAEIRRPNGHIDVEANIQALKDIHANTYFYLIWHAASDWDDLPAFADAAEREGINVWVYLIPWSETPTVKKSWGFSEPYRTDYVRWAQEIAKLSLRHRNIVGYVIDDFYTNSTQPDRFTTRYVRQMVDAGREINPRLKFYPLVYFQQPWAEFMQRFGNLVDGVVAAYPKSRVQVGNALAYLNGDTHGATAIVELARTATRAGDRGAVWADLRVDDPNDATISFYWDDSDLSNNRGYHEAYVRVDGRVVWQADTAGDTADHVINVDLARFVGRARRNVRVELGVYEQRGVTKYPVTVRFDDIRLTGFDTAEMASEKLWTRRSSGNFGVQLLPSRQAPAEVKLPMILMPAGEGEQYEKRYTETGTARNVAAKVRMCMDLLRAGRVEGVVTYCLPKDGPMFDAVGAEFRRAAADLAEPRGVATVRPQRRDD